MYPIAFFFFEFRERKRISKEMTWSYTRLLPVGDLFIEHDRVFLVTAKGHIFCHNRSSDTQI